MLCLAHLMVAVSALALILPAPGAAQLYVFVRTDVADVVYTVNQDAGRTKAMAMVAKKEGSWELLLESNAEGYGAVFCVSDDKSGERRYFHSVGKQSSREAIIDARARGQEYARGVNSRHVFIMRTFHNENRYPLEPPPKKNTTIGVRG